MTTTRHRRGARGEAIAADYLASKGYTILARNVRTPYGEIDCIARDGDTLVFVEVKTRTGDAFGAPEEAVTAQKRRHLCRAALHYLQSGDGLDLPCRFDVLAVRLSGAESAITHFEDAFTCADVDLSD